MFERMAERSRDWSSNLAQLDLRDDVLPSRFGTQREPKWSNRVTAEASLLLEDRREATVRTDRSAEVRGGFFHQNP